MDRPRLVIAEDHEIVIEALVQLLGNRFEVIGRLTDGLDVVEEVCRLRPDVLLLDLSLPHVNGLEVMERLNARQVPFKAVVLTMHADPSLAVASLRMGASAFVLKQSSGRELEKALRLVLEGGTYLPAEITKHAVLLMMEGVQAARVELTERQLDVLRLVVQGQRAKEIAAALSLSTRAVEAIKYRVMHQLRVRSTAELVRFAFEHNIVWSDRSAETVSASGRTRSGRAGAARGDV
jgi:DNA-binding NarL/FixJ family response regulator